MAIGKKSSQGAASPQPTKAPSSGPSVSDEGLASALQSDEERWQAALYLAQNEMSKGNNSDLRRAAEAIYKDMLGGQRNVGEVRGESGLGGAMMALGHGVDDALNFINRGIIGNGLDFVYDNTIGNLTGTRDLFDAQDIGEVFDMAETLGASLIPGVGPGVAALKSGMQHVDDFASLSGVDPLTGQKLEGWQGPARAGSAAVMTALDAVPGLGLATKGITKGIGAATKKAIAPTAVERFFTKEAVQEGVQQAAKQKGAAAVAKSAGKGLSRLAVPVAGMGLGAGSGLLNAYAQNPEAGIPDVGNMANPATAAMLGMAILSPNFARRRMKQMRGDTNTYSAKMNLNDAQRLEANRQALAAARYTDPEDAAKAAYMNSLGMKQPTKAPKQQAQPMTPLDRMAYGKAKPKAGKQSTSQNEMASFSRSEPNGKDRWRWDDEDLATATSGKVNGTIYEIGPKDVKTMQAMAKSRAKLPPYRFIPEGMPQAVPMYVNKNRLIPFMQGKTIQRDVPFLKGKMVDSAYQLTPAEAALVEEISKMGKLPIAKGKAPVEALQNPWRNLIARGPAYSQIGNYYEKNAEKNVNRKDQGLTRGQIYEAMVRR